MLRDARASTDACHPRCVRASSPLRLALAIVLPAVLVWPSAAAGTNGNELIGVSTRARARGGADVAVGDSALSQIDNPATLVLSDDRLFRLDLAGQLLTADTHWRGLIDSADSEVRFSPLGSGAVAAAVSDRLSLGAALRAESTLGSRYHIRHLLIPFMKRRVESDMKDVTFFLSAGYRLTDKLSVGAGVRAAAINLEFSSVLGPADVEFGRGYAYGGGFQLGLHYQVRKDLAFGLAYRSPGWFGDLSGGDAAASLLGLLPVDLGRGRIEDLRLPAKITAGVAWDATDRLKLVGEVRWINYASSSLDSAPVATDGLLDLRLRLPLGYRDQWVFAVGAELELSERWTLGLGYNYGANPVPVSNLFPMGSIIAEHHLTAGLRYERDNWWVGGGYIFGFANTLDGAGHSRIPLGIDYSYSSIEQTQHSLFIGFGFRW